ncbi:hypothetical protein Scep_016671 [Stephania cephalantha]|uniref:Uncharacterized protein n=1 Tax=Stephania cephalantha TaxID=152367 RepID=A0AAP0IPD6_9MAGN
MTHVIMTQPTFGSSQIEKMDRHLGPKFQIPECYIDVFLSIAILCICIYERIIVTKHEEGVTIIL